MNEFIEKFLKLWYDSIIVKTKVIVQIRKEDKINA